MKNIVRSALLVGLLFVCSFLEAQTYNLALSRVITIDTVLSCTVGCQNQQRFTDSYIVPANKVWKLSYLSQLPDTGPTYSNFRQHYRVNGTKVYRGSSDQAIWLKSGDTLDCYIVRTDLGGAWSEPVFLSIIEFNLE